MPVYGVGHFFGDHLLSWCGIDHYELNPSWISSLNSWIKSHIGLSGISFWGFMIGGNILGIALSIICYPMIKRMLMAIKRRGKERVLQTVVQSKRAVKKLKDKAKPLLNRVKRQVKKHENYNAK